MSRSTAALVLLLLTACATTPRSAQLVPFDANLVFGTDLGSMPGRSLYDALLHRNPSFVRVRGISAASALTSRGVPSDAAIGVYINGSFSGGVEALQTLRATDVLSVRRLSPAEAASRMARRHSNGALLVTLR